MKKIMMMSMLTTAMVVLVACTKDNANDWYQGGIINNGDGSRHEEWQ